MQTTIKPIYECPDCPKYQGVLAVDLGSLAVYTTPEPPNNSLGVAVPEILVFSPGAPVKSPCEHLLAFSVLGKLTAAQGSELVMEFDASYRRPDLGTCDLALRQYIEAALACPEDGVLRPGVLKLERCFFLPFSRLQLRVMAKLVVARSAEEILAELAA